MKKIKGINKIYLTVFLFSVLLPLNLKKRDSVLQNIVKAMEDGGNSDNNNETTEGLTQKNLEQKMVETNKPNNSGIDNSILYDNNIKDISYRFARIPSLNPEEEYEYVYFNIDAFRAFGERGHDTSQYKKNTVPLKALKCPLGAIKEKYAFDFKYLDKPLNYNDFEKMENKNFFKNEYSDFLPILEKIYNSESNGGAIYKYNEFIDKLPYTVVDYKKIKDEKNDENKRKVYDFCANTNTVNNKKIYDELVDLVNNHLVPLGRELSRGISSKFEKEEKEGKEDNVYLNCIPFYKVLNNCGEASCKHPENYFIYNLMKYLYRRIEHYALIIVYLECMHGCGSLFYCKEYAEDSKYQNNYQRLRDLFGYIRSNIEDVKCMYIKPKKYCIDPSIHGDKYINKYRDNYIYCCTNLRHISPVDNLVCNVGKYVSIGEPNTVLDIIVHTKKLKAEYLVSKNPELLENKDELLKQIKDAITVEYNLDEFTPEDLKRIGVGDKGALSKMLADIVREANNESVLKKVVDHCIKEAKENLKLKTLADDIENIINQGLDKIIKSLAIEGYRERLNAKGVVKVLEEMIKPEERDKLIAELIMKLEYKINKLIHDKKYDGINREKIYKVCRALIPGIKPSKEYLSEVIEEKLRCGIEDYVKIVNSYEGAISCLHGSEFSNFFDKGTIDNLEKFFEDTFSDVSKALYLERGIKIKEEKGVIKGYSDNWYLLISNFLEEFEKEADVLNKAAPNESEMKKIKKLWVKGSNLLRDDGELILLCKQLDYYIEDVKNVLIIEDYFRCGPTKDCVESLVKHTKLLIDKTKKVSGRLHHLADEIKDKIGIIESKHKNVKNYIDEINS